ncbi:unnamed protein product, partial [Ectocarpus fasciculatus]
TGNRDLVDKLLGAGANGGAGWRGCHGKTLLHAAAEGGSVQVITRLRRAGAGGDTKAKTLDTGRTPLSLAVVGGQKAAVGALIMNGGDVNILDSTNDGPLHLAIKGRHVGIAKDLLLSGANPTQAGSNGDFPIHLAAGRGLDEVVLALVQRGVDPNGTSTGGWTPLYLLQMAARENQAAAVRALVEAGADIEGRGSIALKSPLQQAARFGSCAAMLTLLQLGANVNAKNDFGRTPLFYACVCGGHDHDAADLLLRWGADETAVDSEEESVASIVIRHIAGAPEAWRPRLERISKLLARAPQDRAWRRRGFLVLCRAHPDRVRLEVEIPTAAAEATEQLQERPRSRPRTGEAKVKVEVKVEVEMVGTSGGGGGAGARSGAQDAIEGVREGTGGGFDFVSAW